MSGYFLGMQNVCQFWLSISTCSIIAAILFPEREIQWYKYLNLMQLLLFILLQRGKYFVSNKKKREASTCTFSHWVCRWNKNHLSSPSYGWQKKRLLFFLEYLSSLPFLSFCLIKFLLTKNDLQLEEKKWNFNKSISFNF